MYVVVVNLVAMRKWSWDVFYCKWMFESTQLPRITTDTPLRWQTGKLMPVVFSCRITYGMCITRQVRELDVEPQRQEGIRVEYGCIPPINEL